MIGFGLGLYRSHYQTILETKPKSVDWFEIISENYMTMSGTPFYYLEKIRNLYPIAMHGVSLSIGSAEPLDLNYLKQLKKLIHIVKPLWVSDHFCFSKIDNIHSHDLLPLPYNEECIDFLCERISQVQEYLGQRILLENVSSYVRYTESTIPEWEFISAVAKKADCYLLLDINNVYVNAQNHHFSAEQYLSSIPFLRVKEFHIAGHQKNDDLIIDTHGNKITPAVYDLYRHVIQHHPHIPIVIERDNNTPSFDELNSELTQLREIYDTHLSAHA